MERLPQENQNLKEEKETLRYELKQMLGKILEASN
jgi:FtsZ-binding cell division protein ZapB